MEKQLARLAVTHVLLIVYIVLSAAVFLKIRYGITDPEFEFPPVYTRFGLFLKNYGIWLLVVPAVWSFSSFWQMRRPASDSATFLDLYFSGIVIVVLLLFFALSTVLVLLGGPSHVVRVKATPPPSKLGGARFDSVEPAAKP